LPFFSSALNLNNFFNYNIKLRLFCFVFCGGRFYFFVFTYDFLMSLYCCFIYQIVPARFALNANSLRPRVLLYLLKRLIWFDFQALSRFLAVEVYLKQSHQNGITIFALHAGARIHKDFPSGVWLPF
jgi:hypothetical protein